MTLLVLGIDPPRVPHDELEETLVREVLLWPRITAFAVSFLVLGIYWVGHHTQFHFLRGVDRGLLWINILFLMAVCLVPLYAVAIAVSFLDPRLSLLVVLAVPVLHILPGPIHLHWTR